ncbi:predicted protein [Plenodomus lingam JN3]|uniref:Predicted protein n=1 Tax=Leptosphaeria maculans (strain JN3 / isolate v23.1.3 / race Av1-4-5-6-7-8) TaxID=985895 RepID=E4ZXN8_LEPMJ|nr:predicted protein [Plenodomus lingam JN3]CBX96133.1 predicted protein [Plenodomus lingam JN3]
MKEEEVHRLILDWKLSYSPNQYEARGIPLRRFDGGGQCTGGGYHEPPLPQHCFVSTVRSFSNGELVFRLEDPVEKAHQVSHVGRIRSKAKRQHDLLLRVGGDRTGRAPDVPGGGNSILGLGAGKASAGTVRFGFARLTATTWEECRWIGQSLSISLTGEFYRETCHKGYAFLFCFE